MQVINDNGCSWINDLNPRSNIKTLEKNEDCDWLISWCWLHRFICSKKIRATLFQIKK